MTPLTERNRQNAQHSCGPKTDDGKSRSSQNSLKHGLYSVAALLPGEDQEEYLAHSASYVTDLKAAGPVQTDLVKIISDAMWRLRRVRGLESKQSAVVSRLMDVLAERGGSTILEARYNAEARNLESFGRHEQRIQNNMAKAWKQLKELQKDARLEMERQQKAKPQSGFVSTPKNQAAAASENSPQSAESIPATTHETTLTSAPGQQKAAA